jgi:threonine dehydrogenase-like Zn-dependent dehydrogenase
MTKEVMPVVMGHEFCGRITHAPLNSSLKIGQAVMVNPMVFCRSCYRCDRGGNNACYSWGFKGLSGGGGGLSETVAVEERMCFSLPDTVDLSVAALIEPLAVATHAVKNSEITDFSTKSVLILGGGPVGLAVIAVLRTKGAKAVYVSEPTLKRQKHNEELADLVFNPMKDKVGDRCRELTDGQGVDVVFDCAGNEFAMKDGMDALRWKGLYLNVAGWVRPVRTSAGTYSFLSEPI